MKRGTEDLPSNFPRFLLHADEDAPAPTWGQVTHSESSPNQEMIGHVSRIVGGPREEAEAVWESWPGNYRLSTALLIEKVYDEGWLDLIGPIRGYPWDGGFFFTPRDGGSEPLGDLLESRSQVEGDYIGGRLSNGLFPFLNIWGHWGWERGWMETDTGLVALHVGIFRTGEAEVHFDVFNSLFTRGAPRRDVIRIPLLGAYNHRLWLMHRRWENERFGPISRRSANYYHILRESLELPF